MLLLSFFEDMFAVREDRFIIGEVSRADSKDKIILDGPETDSSGFGRKRSSGPFADVGV